MINKNILHDEIVESPGEIIAFELISKDKYYITRAKGRKI